MMKTKILLGVFTMIILVSSVNAEINLPNGYLYYDFENDGHDNFYDKGASITGGTYITGGNQKVGTYAVDTEGTEITNTTGAFTQQDTTITNVSTFSFWVQQKENVADEYMFTISDGLSDADHFGAWIDGSGNLEVRYRLASSSVWNEDIFAGGLTLDTWFMLTFVQEGSLLQAYVNNEIVANQSDARFLTGDFDSITFGGGDSTYGDLDTWFDNAVLDQDAWDSDDVAAAYNSGSGDTFSSTAPPEEAPSSTQTNTATFTEVQCGLAINGTEINFGSVDNNEISVEQSLILNNTGNTEADIDIAGTEWAAGDENFAVEKTRFDNVTGAYLSKTELTGTDQRIQDNLGSFTLMEAFFQMSVPPITNATSFSQNITYTIIC